jgi:hypothetical protein
MTNSGTIAGGVGGAGWFTGLDGAAGGTGVSMTGASMANAGLIIGGTGGAPSGGPAGGNGGTGVYLNGGTLINAGTIAGGAAGGYGAVAGDAVQFGAQAATLIVDPGALFTGNVVANPGAADTLILAGTGGGALSGLGSQFTGFATVKETRGATWDLSGTNSTAAGSTLNVWGSLNVSGSLAVSGTVNVFGTVTGNLQIDGFGFIGPGGFADGATIGAGGQLFAAAGGSVGDATVDSGGMAILQPGATGVGTLDFAGPGGALVWGGSGALGEQLAGFAPGDVLDLRGLAYAAAGSANLNGLALTVTEAGVSDQVQFAPGSGFSGTTWQLGDDGHGGTAVLLHHV